MPVEHPEKYPGTESNVLSMNGKGHEEIGEMNEGCKPDVDAVTALKAANPELFHSKIPLEKTETLKGPEALTAMVRDAGLTSQQTKKKICILGTAPQWQMAPFDDPTWEIWGIFGVSLVNKRLTRLYELHEKAIIEAMVAAHSPDGRYWKVAQALGANFITRDAYAQTPDATRFDYDGKLKKYGKYFASSAAWLLADAIDQNPEEIAIFGVNMAADEEYAYQKPSMTYLIGWARAQGIKVTTPASSELLTLTHQYGLEQPPRFHAAMAQRRLELNGQLGAHKQNLLNAQLSIASIEGALNQIAYFEQNWKA